METNQFWDVHVVQLNRKEQNSCVMQINILFRVQPSTKAIVSCFCLF